MSIITHISRCPVRVTESFLKSIFYFFRSLRIGNSVRVLFCFVLISCRISTSPFTVHAKPLSFFSFVRVQPVLFPRSLPPTPLQSRFRKFALHQTLSFSAVYTVVSRFSFFCLCFPPKYAIANMNPKVPHPLSHDRTAKGLRGTLRLSLLYLSTDPFFTQRHGSKSLLILLMNDLRLGAVWPPFHHRKRRMPSGILRNASTMVPSKLQCSSQV